jgi:Inosine-uridine nucleoside N-ribohydrolase
MTPSPSPGCCGPISSPAGARIRIETSGTRDGETVFDWREDGNCRVLLQGKDEGFFDFLIERLARL